MRAWREAFHREPELSYHEKATREKVTAALDELGIPYRTYSGFYGVLALLGEGRPGPVVALRADMDALPVTEATGLPYRSRIEGRMHACGHDMHVACLLGAAHLLATARDDWSGTLIALFQPAEETGDGARGMLCRS